MSLVLPFQARSFLGLTGLFSLFAVRMPCKVAGCRGKPIYYQIIKRDGELRVGGKNLCQSHHPQDGEDHRNQGSVYKWRKAQGNVPVSI